MLFTSSECGSSGSATEKTWEVTIHNSVIKQKINVFKSYLFKLLFILMILSSSSLLEEKKINLTSIKACPESKGRFTLKQLFLSSLKYNTCVTSINYGNAIYPSKLSSNSSFSKESFPVLLMNRVPSILGILADFFFFSSPLWYSPYYPSNLPTARLSHIHGPAPTPASVHTDA